MTLFLKYQTKYLKTNSSEINYLISSVKNTLPKFSHIYVEKDALNYPLTESVLSKYGSSKMIEINNYKEIFNRSNQNFQLQKFSMKLILAIKKHLTFTQFLQLCRNLILQMCFTQHQLLIVYTTVIIVFTGHVSIRQHGSIC